jgi:hypothetical protein
MTPTKGKAATKSKFEKTAPKVEVGTVLLSAEADLFYWEANKAEFEFQGTSIAQISRVSQYQCVPMVFSLQLS